MSNKKKVLVVDDNQNFSQLLQYALEDDFETYSESDGRAGVDTAIKILPDLILMDVMMPEISGIEMARILVAKEETRDIPIVVLTGSHLDKGMPALFKQERNVRFFLSKATPVMDIVEIVKRILSVD
ncbi:MAG: response regulator [Elusimicrobiales bacterium]|nr:response regulator [Elusimicrobiales bacterium]